MKRGSPLPINESLLTEVVLVPTYFYRKTSHIYTGAFINAIFINWVIVAGTATHFAIQA